MSAAQKRAALYLRISLDATGEMLAVERQREDCLKLCHDRGWSVVAEFVDNSISASDARKKRPGYDALASAYDAGGFDALVCWDLDRLTRQPRQLEDWIDRARSGGLVIVTANGEADLSTDGGMLFARIKLAVARGEVDRKSARQTRALQQRADLGKPPLGVRLTGYTSKGVVIEDEARIVRRIFQEFINGESLKGIAGRLQADGIETRRGGRWNSSSIATILRNPRYAGLAIYKGQATGKQGQWEPLISEDQFALVQSRLADPRRKTNKVGTHRRHLGSGLFLCCVCGSRIYAWSGDRYRCPNTCLVRSIAPVDRYVNAVIRARLGLTDVLARMRKAPAESAAPLEAEARELRARLERIEGDYDAGHIDGRRYSAATDKVRIELQAIERKLAVISGDAPLVDLLNRPDPAAAFDNLTLMAQRTVLDSLMTVVLRPGKHGSRTFDPATVPILWNGATTLA
ncbi:Recombinase [Kribbella flavida DSM 17836]|uniref:Recombinase n=1 Tax=Kribbella flavida (strain DSM 17836 / JCM 10339 / NBRC 14399) TaxID=479435 RepID=D2PN80_KRIFD|nr:recombinase family protein [Kribbella flavida]ADB34564.1 Recombinase [Kribbella flavida DSM 17836]